MGKEEGKCQRRLGMTGNIRRDKWNEQMVEGKMDNQSKELRVSLSKVTNNYRKMSLMETMMQRARASLAFSNHAFLSGLGMAYLLSLRLLVLARRMHANH